MINNIKEHVKKVFTKWWGEDDSFVTDFMDEVYPQLFPEKVETPEDIRKYVGKAKYDEMGQIIFRGADKNNLQQFLDVRGWGAIQNMDEFKTMDDAANFQDKVGQWVTEVINEKLNEIN